MEASNVDVLKVFGELSLNESYSGITLDVNYPDKRHPTRFLEFDEILMFGEGTPNSHPCDRNLVLRGSITSAIGVFLKGCVLPYLNLRLDVGNQKDSEKLKKLKNSFDKMKNWSGVLLDLGCKEHSKNADEECDECSLNKENNGKIIGYFDRMFKDMRSKFLNYCTEKIFSDKEEQREQKKKKNEEWIGLKKRINLVIKTINDFLDEEQKNENQRFSLLPCFTYLFQYFYVKTSLYESTLGVEKGRQRANNKIKKDVMIEFLKRCNGAMKRNMGRKSRSGKDENEDIKYYTTVLAKFPRFSTLLNKSTGVSTRGFCHSLLDVLGEFGGFKDKPSKQFVHFEM